MAPVVPCNLAEMSSAKAEGLQLSRIYIMRMPFVQQATLRLAALTDDGTNQIPIPRVTASPWDMPRADQVNNEPVGVPLISTTTAPVQYHSQFMVHNDEQNQASAISLQKSIHLRNFAKQRAPAVQSPCSEIFPQPNLPKPIFCPSSVVNGTKNVEYRDYTQDNTVQPSVPKLAPAFGNDLKRKMSTPCESSQAVKPAKLPKIVVDLTSPEGLVSKVVIDLRTPEEDGHMKRAEPPDINETKSVRSQTGAVNSISKGSISATGLIASDVQKHIQQYGSIHSQHACPETFHPGASGPPPLEESSVINTPMSSYDPFANRHFPSKHHRRENSAMSYIPDLATLLSGPEAFNRRTVQDLPPQTLRVLGNCLSENFEAVRYGSNELTSIPDGMKHLKIMPISDGRSQPRVISPKTASRSSSGRSSFERSQSTVSMRSSPESSNPASVCWVQEEDPDEGWGKQFDVYCDSSEEKNINEHKGNQAEKNGDGSAEHIESEPFSSPQEDATKEEEEEDDDDDEDGLPPYWAPSLSSLMKTHLSNKNTLIEETLPVKLTFTIAPYPGNQSHERGTPDNIDTHQRVLVIEKLNVARLRMLRFVLPSLESRWIDGPGLQGQGGITARSNLPRDWVVFEIVERRNPDDVEDLYKGGDEGATKDDDDHGRSFLHIAVPYQAITNSRSTKTPTSAPVTASRPPLPPVPTFCNLAAQLTPPPYHQASNHHPLHFSRTPDHDYEDDDKPFGYTKNAMNEVKNKTESMTTTLLLQKKGKYPLLHGRALFSNNHNHDDDEKNNNDDETEGKVAYAHKLFMIGNWADACAEGRGGVVIEV